MRRGDGMLGDRRIRLLILLPNLVSGGGQRITINFFRALDRSLFKPTLLVQERNGAYLAEVERDCDPDEVMFLLDRPYSRWDLPWLTAKTYAHAWHADIIFGALESRAAYCGLIAAKLLRKPFVAWIHVDWRPFSEMVSWRQIVGLKSYRLATRVIGCSEGSSESVRQLFGVPPHKIKTILNMVPRTKILANGEEILPEEHTALFEKPTVVMVARFDPQKDQDTLLQAHAKVLSQGIDHNLILLGRGDTRRGLEEKAFALGVASSVHFVGFQENPHRYMRNATVFALSSHFEGLPLVLIEALMLGTPIVASDCLSGPAELLDGGKYGLLVPVRDPDALAAALGSLLSDDRERTRLSKLGEERGRSFDEDRVMDIWNQELVTLAG